jgi:hypothetical protein
VIPVMSARFTRFPSLSVHARHRMSGIPSSWRSHSSALQGRGVTASFMRRVLGRKTASPVASNYRTHSPREALAH